MAASSRGKSSRLIDQLVEHPHRFNFFQAVHLLELYAWSELAGNGDAKRATVGEDFAPSKEVVRFRVQPSLAFPKSAIARLTGLERPAQDTKEALPPQLEVAFFGLCGPVSVLPEHYTSTILQRLHQKDSAFRDFLDLFHHRLLSFFYRAKVKYSIPLSYVREHRWSRSGRSAADAYTHCLLSLVGMGMPALRHRLGIDDEALLRHAGILCRKNRPASGLAMLLSGYFKVPAEIIQFQGGWLYLHDRDMSRLPGPSNMNGRLELGQNMVLGRRVYDRQSKFRVRLGAVNFDRFREFLPIGKYHRTLSELIRFFAGLELNFDVQLVLKAADVPAMRLSVDEEKGPRLGWTSWVFSQPPQAERGDVVFSLDDRNADD